MPEITEEITFVEIDERTINMFEQMHACTTKEDIFNITPNHSMIIGAIEYATMVEAARLLLSCLDLDLHREMLLDVLPRVKLLEIAELIVDAFDQQGIPIDFDQMTGSVPYYATELDLQLVSYFIHKGGSPRFFISSYLEEL